MAEANEEEHKEEGNVEAAEPLSVSAIELEQLRRESQEYKDKYLRTLAESENLRKRLQKERQELVQYAIQNVVLDFLHPLDHMENALSFTDNMSDEVKHWAHGFQMILTQFKDALANNGVIPFASKGHPFDPHFHEAIEMVETDDVAPGTIVEENIRGYKIGDKIIRPARVKVAKAVAQEEEELQKNNDKE